MCKTYFGELLFTNVVSRSLTTNNYPKHFGICKQYGHHMSVSSSFNCFQIIIMVRRLNQKLMTQGCVMKLVTFTDEKPESTSLFSQSEQTGGTMNTRIVFWRCAGWPVSKPLESTVTHRPFLSAPPFLSFQSEV